MLVEVYYGEKTYQVHSEAHSDSGSTAHVHGHGPMPTAARPPWMGCLPDRDHRPFGSPGSPVSGLA